MNEETPFYVCLGTGCGYQERVNGRYHETDKFKFIEFHFKFASEELYDLYSDYNFEDLIHVFGDEVQRENKDYFPREDSLVPVRDITEKDAINYCVVDVDPCDCNETNIYWIRMGDGVKSAR